jgi:hypothetical protein
MIQISERVLKYVDSLHGHSGIFTFMFYVTVASDMFTMFKIGLKTVGLKWYIDQPSNT